ncbi:VOC family protein [Paraherbaspirillum soli]|uniref:VOC family protein n=1 Tax=Paraherbaspirillum soli TaxID=631222 RepID=A0ABW0MBF3_9BURK
MSSPNLIILYVSDPVKSIPFYRELLNRDPIASFPTYVAFALDGGFTLGLWASHRVNPAPPQTGNRTELAFTVADDAAVEVLHREWRERGVKIEQAPNADVFGLTFVALDPDGHRIRVCPVGN